MLTTDEMEFLRMFRNADDTDKMVILDMLLCFAYCGEDFIKEFQEAKTQGKDAMRATVEKYAAPLRKLVTI